MDDHQKVFDKIFKNPLILQNILKNFPAQYLNSIQSTNKEWKSIVSTIFEQRSRISWALLDIANDKFPIDDHLAINYWDLVFRTINICPNFMLLCLSYNLFVQCYKISGDSKRSKKTISLLKYLQSKIPEGCYMPFIVSDGIIGTSIIDHTIYEFESGKSFSSYMFSCDSTPDKFDIQTLCMPKKHICYLLQSKGGNNLPNYFTTKTGKPFPSLAKSVIVFADSILDTSIMKKLLNHIRETYANTGGVVISGSLVDNLGLIVGSGPNHNIDNNNNNIMKSSLNRVTVTNPNISVVILFFSGAEIDQAILNFIPSAMTDKAQIENSIKSFSSRYQSILKSQTLKANATTQHGNAGPRRYRTPTFGFAFSCIGRGKHLYAGEENVETSLFAKYFPGIPLLGVFGNGEIGYVPRNQFMDFEEIEKLVPAKIPIIEPVSGVNDRWNEPDSQSDIVIYNNAHSGSVVERSRMPLILEEMTEGDRKSPKLCSQQYIYYYSTILCLIVMNPKTR